MSGVIKTLEGLNAVSKATGTYDFVSYSNFYSTGNVKGLRLIKSTGKTLGTTGTWGEIIPYTNSLTGGASNGVSAINFSSKSAGSLSASKSGALVSIPAIQLVGAILGGLGLGIVAYEANPALWVDISNKIFSIIPGYVPITEEEIPALSFTTLFKNGKTHVPDYLLEHSASVLNDLGAFGSDIILEEGDVLPKGEYVTIPASKFSKEMLISCIKKMNEFNTVPANKPNPALYVDEIISGLMQAYINATPENMPNKNISAQDALFNEFDYCYIHISYLTTLSNKITVSCFNVNESSFKVETDAIVSKYGNVTQRLDCYTGLKAWIESRLANNQLAGITVGVAISFNNDGTLRTEYTSGQDMSVGSKFEPYYGFSTLSETGYEAGISAMWFFSPNTFVTSKSLVEGINPLAGAIVPSVFPLEFPNTFPEWWASRIGWSNLNPEIETNPLAYPFIDFNYLPLAVPNTSPVTAPMITPQPIIQAGEVPATNPEPVIEGTAPVIEDIPDPNPPGGGGDTPVLPPIPTLGGTATALYTVYNPTKEQLNGLGAYLWSEDALSILQQLFQNPLESVIGLHILYATPSTGNSKVIKLGYLNSGVSANEVINQYINIECGSINVAEYFGDARDYSPYTQINIYLPFIGIRQLDVNEVMASVLSVDYKVDVLTGTCLCNITVSKDGYSQVLYVFEGNCAVQLPLTGADKSRLLTGVIGGAFAGGMLGGTGGAVVGAIKGAIGGIRIQKTGSIGSNSGAMGIKIPYLIITRQKPYDALNYNKQYGYPANMTIQLSSCKGYTRVKEVHVENILVATQEEKDMIQTLLRQGVIIE